MYGVMVRQFRVFRSFSSRSSSMLDPTEHMGGQRVCFLFVGSHGVFPPLTFEPLLVRFCSAFGPFWSAFGPPFVCFWSAFGLLLVRFWSAFGPLLICFWSAFGPLLVHF